MSSMAAFAAGIGPWALLGTLIMVSLLVMYVVHLVLKIVPAVGDRAVSFRFRFLWCIRIEIDVKHPGARITGAHEPRSGDPPSAEVVPLRDDARKSG